MQEFIIFVCTDSAEIFFSKLRSAGLNYNLPSFFTESYCAGVSNKHCLLIFSLFLLTKGLMCVCYTCQTETNDNADQTAKMLILVYTFVQSHVTKQVLMMLLK